MLLLGERSYGGSIGLLCLTFCFFPALAIDCLQTNSAGEDYTGTENTTISGRPCVPWINLARCGQILPDKNLTLAENFCRNPNPDLCHQDKRYAPWCYFGTQNNQWEYCDVVTCDGQSVSCSSALGMGNGEIADSQITASSFDSVDYAPYKARINSSNSGFWLPRCCPDRNYLKIDLLTPHIISKLYVQGGSNYNYVQRFNVLYSLDDLVWSVYSDSGDGAIQEFPGNTGANIVPIYFNRPFTAVKIAIVPRSWYSRLGLRLEIFGCPTNATVPVPRGTEVTQNIQASSIQWTRENSPYVVRQRISVALGATLTIDAAVKVVFAGQDSGLNVAGCVQFNGLKDFEVQLLSKNPLSLIFNSDENGQPFWQGVTINSIPSLCAVREISQVIIHGANNGLALTIDNFQFSSIVVKNSQTGLAITRTGKGTTVSIVSSIFDGNRVGFQMQLFGNTTILSTTFSNNFYAVSLVHDSSTSQLEQTKSLEIQDSAFLGNNYGLYGIDVYYFYYNNLFLQVLRFFNNTFSGSQIYVYDSYYETCSSVLAVEVDECKLSGTQMTIKTCQNYSLLFNNSFTSNFSGTAISLSGQCRSLKILNSVFSEINGNSLSVSTYPIDSQQIDNNTFTRNTGSSCISIITENRQNYRPRQISITRNTFENNSVSNVIYIKEGVTSANLRLNENAFDDPSARYELYEATPYKYGYLVDAGRNWWGGSDRNATLPRIYDFYTDFLSAIVDISSVYREQEMVTLMDSSTWRDWKFDGLNIGGQLRQNTSIDLDTLETSAITATSSIYVPKNTELKLIGSRNLSFADYVGIMVEGVLLLNGSQGKGTLRLRPRNPNGQWGGIWFVNSQAGSCLSNVDLMGLRSEVRLRNSLLTVVNSTLDIAKGISCDGSIPMTLVIADSLIYSSSGTSVGVNVNSDQVTLSITNSRISSRSNDAVVISAYSSVSLTLESSYIETQYYYGRSVAVNSQTSNSNLTANIGRSVVLGGMNVNTAYTNLTLRNNTFNLSGNAYALNIDSQGSLASVTLQQNLFIGSLIYLILFGPRLLDISDNIFNNSINGAIEIQLQRQSNPDPPPKENNAIKIQDNVLTNINGNQALLIGCTTSTEYVASIQVTGNTFISNSVTYALNSNCRGLYLTENKFLTPLQSIAYRTSVPSSSGVDLYATGNFWNASNLGDIAAKIYDQQDDPSVSPVEISPWFNDINMASLGKAENTFFRSGVLEIGGTLTEDVTLQNKGQAYVVDEDIYIPYGKTLRIEDGVQLVFKQGGITVEGLLLALGSENSWISMRSETNGSSWRGISFQQKFSDEIYQHASGWWEVFIQSQWRALEYQRNVDPVYTKRLADIVCRQAGFSVVKDFGPYNCSSNTTPKDSTSTSTQPPGTSSTSSSLSDKAPPCNDLTQRVQIYCNENSKILQDCNTDLRGNSQNSLLRLECLPQTPADTRIVYKIVGGAGDEVTLTLNDSLALIKDNDDSLSKLFVAFRPCLAGSSFTSDCVSFMSLRKPGWFLRHLGPSQLIVEPKSNPTNSSTFLSDASFMIRQDQFVSGFLAFESLNLPNNFVSVRNDATQLLVLQNSSSLSGESGSFRLAEPTATVRRRKRQTPGVSPNEKSHLRFVRISFASVGVTVDGVAPQLDSIVVENSTGSGILQRGYASEYFTIANSTIAFNRGGGISLTTTYNQIYSYQINIVGCVIVGNAGNGIVSTSRGNITITNCTVANNTQAGIDLDVSSSSSLTATVESSQISGHSNSALNCDGVCIVRNNLFVQNLAYCFSGNGRALLEGNVFDDNGLFRNPKAKAMSSFTYGTVIEFINNIVKRNKYSITVYFYTAVYITITGNTFVNNSYDSSAGNYGSVIELNIINGRNVKITGNYFDNPLVGYEIQINTDREYDYNQRTFNLSFNFWNRQNYSGIVQRISCFFNDMKKISVNIWPAVLNPESNFLLTIPDDNSYFFENGTGGDVYTSLVIPSSNQTYAIERSIHVEMGAILTIESGVILKFRSGRGILVKGTLILEGSIKSPVTFTRWLDAGWGGFILMQPLYSNFTSGLANLSHLIIEGSPATVTITAPTILIDTLSTTDSSVTLQGGNITVTNSAFNHAALTLTSSSWFDYLARIAIITNSVFNSSNSGTGLYVQYQTFLYISDCIFTNNDYGVQIYDSPNTAVPEYSIRNSRFQQNLRAVYTRTGNFEFINNIIVNDKIDQQDRVSGLQISAFDILIQNNTFANLSKRGVYIDSQSSRPIISTITIRENTFNNIAGTPLTLNNILYTISTIQNNIFAMNTFTSGPASIAISLWYTSAFYSILGNISVIQNRFEQNSGQQIVKFVTPAYTSDSNYPSSKLSSNLFLNNIAIDSTIFSQYHRLDVNYNIFKNPQTTTEIKVGFSNSFQENCTNNWWGSTNDSEIASRLYDRNDDSSLGLIVYDPFLNASEFSCETVSGCSGHGLCILPETCACFDGWKGPDCSQASCSSVQDCYNRGRCTGPNVCQCNDGWFGDCSRATCTEQKNCSGHGICIAPNQCLCSDQYSGTDCSECGDGRWGPSCLLCPRCVHGTCDKANGKCVCSGANWAGDLCDTCAPKYFGAVCLPVVRFIRIAPVSGPDIGNTSVHAYGANFPNVTSYRCRFDDTTVPGVWLSDEDILCLSPVHPAGQVVFYLSIAPDQGFLDIQFYFSYYPYCPSSACGSQVTPSRGGCSMGTCTCFVPWIGSDCSVLGLPPKIVPVSSQTLLEAASLNFTFQLAQGTTPVEWQLLNGPNGMLLNALSGQLQWSRAVAKLESYKVTIGCKSEYGSDQMTFNLSVPPSYYAVLDSLAKGPFVRLPSVLISGKINWNVNNTFLSGQQFPVNIIINNSGSKRTISTITISGTDGFYERFYPSQYDVGLFQVDARHPADPGFSAQQSWSVYGLQIQVMSSTLTGYTGIFSYPSLLNVTNVGSDSMTELQLLKVNVPFELRIWNSVLSPCVLSAAPCPLSLVLQPGDSVVLNASIKVETAYSGYFTIVASTRETVSASATVSFSFQEKLPSFRLSPGNIDVTVSQGKTYYYQVNVTNVGLRSATNVKINLPNEPMIFVLSFGTSMNPTGDNLIMASGDSAILVIQVTPSVQENIGIRRGSIQIKSLETSSLFYYRFVIASVDRLDLTVSVEDEYTYFSADKPLLANATVSLTSQFGGGTITLVTIGSGQATFRDIREDYYTLYTSADRHRPDSRVIFASAGNASFVTVFIQRVAVTYSWLVTPVTFEDRYDIKLEADFTTNVPIPVVTLTPNRLDLDVLERGLMPVISFTIRNYGLIAAKGFRFQLPAADAHPFLLFQMDRELVGDIPANSTLVVAVSVIINETKRIIYFSQIGLQASNCSGTYRALTLTALYYYICDHERYEYLFVSVYYASAYINCGGSGIGGGGGGGFWIPDGGAAGPYSTNTGVSVTSPCKKVVSCLQAAFPCISAGFDAAECLALASALPESVVGEPVVVIITAAKTVRQCYDAYESISECYSKVVACINASNDDLYQAIVWQYIYVAEYYRLGEIVYGDLKWIDGGDTRWLNEIVQPATFDTSPGGHLITEFEYAQIMNSPLPINITAKMAKTFLQRLNGTFYSWDQGLYNSTDNNTIDHSAFIASTDTLSFGAENAKEAGFSSMPAMYLDTYGRLQQAESSSDDGVCAKVRIQILQRLVLTRSAFSARLEIENGETNQLSDIRVEILITDFDDQDPSNDRFSIGQPELSGISDVSGTGNLPVNTKGSAQWLIAPYSAAAPTADKRYRIGGTLYYTVNGENITVPLFPDTVTVKPDPRLYISYFLEKYVNADDPLTTDVIEPVVPFSLGILITNDGCGVASNLQLTSAQPEIIDNEKGLLIKFTIIGTQLGNTNISPSLKVDFGDIFPKTTKVARFIMTSTLSGTFSNCSATFQNTNPLGDPQLSVLDSLNIYDKLHDVKVDYPKDDGIVDFLTINPSSLDSFPNRIYTSDNGTQPLNVSIGNITMLNASNGDSFQVTTACVSCVGWTYFRTEYQLSQKTVYNASRSDGRVILPDYNIWIGKIKKKTYLHIVDYMSSSDSSFTYNVRLSQSYAEPPKFSQDVYNVSVVEESNPGPVVSVSVTNRDANQTLLFSLRDDGSQQPFSIGASDGVVSSTSRLDREVQDQYSLVVLATDSSIPPLTGTAFVSVNVDDINDNAPVFGDVPSNISVSVGTPAGYVLYVITASDRDLGPNGTVQLYLSDASGLFELDSSTGYLATRSPLEATGVYQLLMTATDEGTPSRSTNISIKIHVIKQDLHSPLFSSVYYVFNVNETKLLRSVVGQLNVSDADDPEEKFTFEIITSPPSDGCNLPFQIDNSGKITNIQELRSDTCSQYNFTVRVTDSGAPPSGPLSETVNVTINIIDINDNAPEFQRYEFTVHVAENSPNETILLILKAFDRDTGMNGVIVDYTLAQIYPESTSMIVDFRLDVIDGEAILKAVRPLNREQQDHYTLQIVAEDGGHPSLHSKPVTVDVIVDDVNDNSPMFLNSTGNVTITRSTPTNAVVFNVRAFDADSSAVFRYVQVTDDQYFQVQPTTGAIMLVKSLQGVTNISNVVVKIYATDGLFNSTTTFTLIVHISDENAFPPRFEAHEYRITVNETESVGNILLRLSATDPETAFLYYAITAGNSGNRFKLDSITGDLVLVGQLSWRMNSFYNLTVEVFDSPFRDNGTLSDQATIYITVLQINEYSPVFTNGPEVQVHLTEGRIMSRFLQVTATDGDGDNVTYSILDSGNISDHLFVIDRDSGWLSQVSPLYRQVAYRYVLQIAATDNGIPSRQSVIDVIIFVDEDVPTSNTVSMVSAINTTENWNAPTSDTISATTSQPSTNQSSTISAPSQPLTNHSTISASSQPPTNHSSAISASSKSSINQSSTTSAASKPTINQSSITSTTTSSSVNKGVSLRRSELVYLIEIAVFWAALVRHVMI